MSRALPVRRTLAASAALAVAAWGAAALPATADPGQDQGQSQHQGKGPKGNNGNGPKADQGQGPKGNNGNGPKADQGQGPKGNNGNGPKADQGQGPKGNQGNGQGQSQGQGDQGNGDPAGNNGTVKITPIGQDDGIPQNNPHVPCGFDIEWYGFDEGPDIVSTITLAPHAPTADAVLTPGGPSEVFVGGDPATGAGTDTGFDGEATYYPTFDGEPHAQQGYHVKLTVHTPRSQGADTKHKVFWVEPCETEVAGEEAPAEETTGDRNPDDTEVLGEQAAVDSERGDDTEVMGAQASAPEVAAADAADVPNAVDAGEDGAGLTGALTSPPALALLLLGMALAAIGVVARRRAS